MTDNNEKSVRGMNDMAGEGMSESVKVSILVVSFNTRDETLEALRSVVKEARDVPYELIVVDNASKDGSAAAIRAEFPDIRLIASEQNLGFGKANNLAATEAKGDFLLLLNPDTVTLRGAVDRLVDFAMAYPDNGIWGGRQYYPDLSLNATSCWRQMTIWGQLMWALGLLKMFPDNGLFNYDGYGGWDRSDIREVETVSGSFLLIRRDLWEKLDGFDTTFIMYGEDADLCCRARQAGARPIVTPNAEIIHYGGRSEKVRADKMERLLRAKVAFSDTHSNSFHAFVFRLVFRTLVIVRLLGFSLRKAIRRDQRSADSFNAWRDVWARRRTWLQGY
ncbi:glycosyltransferase family 2 protein [Ruegeria sp. Ofav3-42]|uniref:glycosyltransferase family 2 protein n=1 Tax=Ruegeria sp. Ofav3-42 TaxID=2917759 RepID=UPI001EF71C91|nr:glycosyltransferase family 2 protein [Ruegeria sp. Ofav3-42]MCG7522387.1 glycosyltransferase family 2 protein [Ruegeria sp. Ofav3-42]